MTHARSIYMGPEIMKLLRDNNLSRDEIAEFLGWDIKTVSQWCAEYEAQGILAAQPAPATQSASGRGRPPMLYTVAQAWKGGAA